MIEFKEKLNPGKLTSTDKIKPKQVTFQKLEFDQVESSFEEQLQFCRHILSNHYTKQCDQCDQCDFSTTTTTHLKTHQTQHLRPAACSICSICGQAFRRRLQALEHKAAAHIEVKSAECDQCEEKFTSRKRFVKHKQSHLSNQSPLCAECDNTFVCKLSHKNHKSKVHIVKYGLKCDLAVKSVVQNLNREVI